jgi:hypothetical protein
MSFSISRHPLMRRNLFSASTIAARTHRTTIETPVWIWRSPKRGWRVATRLRQAARGRISAFSAAAGGGDQGSLVGSKAQKSQARPSAAQREAPYFSLSRDPLWIDLGQGYESTANSGAHRMGRRFAPDAIVRDQREWKTMAA